MTVHRKKISFKSKDINGNLVLLVLNPWNLADRHKELDSIQDEFHFITLVVMNSLCGQGHGISRLTARDSEFVCPQPI